MMSVCRGCGHAIARSYQPLRSSLTISPSSRQRLPRTAPTQHRDYSDASGDEVSSLSALGKGGEKVVILSGIQPTGVPHLGNYLGAMRQWKRLQDEAPVGSRLLFSIVDLHAITMPQDPSVLMQNKREMLAAMLAIGLDPDKSTLFYQSSVPQHSELMWILSCTASMGYLGRMTQWKSKLQETNKGGDLGDAFNNRLKLGLFSYPVLQAADILVHGTTHVPVGDDQRQHLEFARECVTNFNATYGGVSSNSSSSSSSKEQSKIRNILTSPRTITTHFPRIMSLQNPTNKMSKSAPNPRSRILLTSDPAEIRRRVSGAVTDSLGSTVTYDPTTRPGVANLLELLAQCSSSGSDSASGNNNQSSPEEIAQELAGANAGLGELKRRVADAVVQELEGVRERFESVLNQSGGRYIDEVANAGGEAARQSAEETMRRVRDAVGLASGV